MAVPAPCSVDDLSSMFQSAFNGCSHAQIRLKFYIRQQCAAAIFGVLEAAATTGVLCRLKNVQNRDTIRVLFPRLISMNFDQPESQLFFGHQNNQSCSHCTRRRFRSAFRKSTPQVGTIVHRLYDIANGNNPQFRDMARNKLKRRGFNFERRCCLPRICRNLFLRLPGRDDVFPCVDFRDALHGLVMFLVGQLMESCDYVPFDAPQRRTLDRRLAILGNDRLIRAPGGCFYRRQKSIFSDVGMTAMDRIQLLFYLPHVFGPAADTILPHHSLYEPLMTAIARTQLIIIASRGLRVYKQSELRDIFDQGYLMIFGCLQRLREICYRLRVRRHEQQPNQYKRPKDLLERPDRVAGESDTTDTDDEADLGGYDYSHGALSLIHQHWVLQVILAGSFHVHCTQSAEAAHKTSAKLAASRARHQHSMQTLRNMTTYLCNHTVFEHLKDFFPSPPSSGPVCDVTYGVKVLLPSLMTGDGAFTTQRFQRTLLHEEIAVTRVELMDMLCDQFVLPKTLATYHDFERLGFEFAQKFISSCGETYWATDTRYPYTNTFGQRVRRDSLFIKGSVKRKYRLQDGRRVERWDSLCAETTCFLKVSGLSQLSMPALDPNVTPFRKEFRNACHNDSITFLLVRWFEPHPDSHQRDDMNRPVCPGPLHINHCLWTYAKTDNPRRSLPGSAMSWTRTQKRAYYGLIFPHNVLNKVNITPCFLNGSTDTGNTFLESVTLL